MKRYNFIKIWMLWVTPFLFTNCEDALEPKVYDQLIPETFFATEADIKSSLTPLYATFGTDWGASDPGTGAFVFNLNVALQGYDWMTRIMTDQSLDRWNFPESLYTWGPATWPSSGSNPNHFYNRIRFVARATDLIKRIEEAPVTSSIKNKYLAEARVLRAWYMFILYDLYGPLNVKLNYATLTSNAIEPRLSKQEYLSAMEADLLEAVATSELPDRLNNDASNWGRVSKGVARMILLKMYMQEKQWEKAQTVATELNTMGYSLLSSYKDVFITEANSEIIYGVPSNPGMRQYWYKMILPDNAASVLGVAVQGGWYGEGMRWEFYDKYPEGDKRLETIADSYINNNKQIINRANGLSAAIPMKYTNFKPNDEGFGYVVYRYADVLLSLAEIKNELNGPTAEAVGYAQQVTDRAGISIPASATVSKEAFRDFLLDERGRELYAEFGIRRQDLIRHGKLIEYAKARGVSIADNKHILLPIPSNVIIESSGIIEQNPGY